MTLTLVGYSHIIMSIVSLTPEIANSLARLATMSDTMAILKQKLSFNDKDDRSSLLEAVNTISNKMLSEDNNMNKELEAELDPNSDKNKGKMNEIAYQLRQEQQRIAADREALFSEKNWDTPLTEKTIKHAEHLLNSNVPLKADEATNLLFKSGEAKKNGLVNENTPAVEAAAAANEIIKPAMEEIAHERGEDRVTARTCKNLNNFEKQKINRHIKEQTGQDIDISNFHGHRDCKRMVEGFQEQKRKIECRNHEHDEQRQNQPVSAQNIERNVRQAAESASTSR